MEMGGFMCAPFATLLTTQHNKICRIIALSFSHCLSVMQSYVVRALLFHALRSNTCPMNIKGLLPTRMVCRHVDVDPKKDLREKADVFFGRFVSEWTILINVRRSPLQSPKWKLLNCVPKHPSRRLTLNGGSERKKHGNQKHFSASA